IPCPRVIQLGWSCVEKCSARQDQAPARERHGRCLSRRNRYRRVHPGRAGGSLSCLCEGRAALTAKADPKKSTLIKPRGWWCESSQESLRGSTQLQVFPSWPVRGEGSTFIRCYELAANQ